MVETPLENWGNSFHIEFEFFWTKTVWNWENIFMVDGLGSKLRPSANLRVALSVNGSQLINTDISGAIFTLNLSILKLISE